MPPRCRSRRPRDAFRAWRREFALAVLAWGAGPGHASFYVARGEAKL